MYWDDPPFRLGRHWALFREPTDGLWWVQGWGERFQEFVAWLRELDWATEVYTTSYELHFRLLSPECDVFLRLRWGEYFDNEPFLHPEWRAHIDLAYEYYDDLFEDLWCWPEYNEDLTWARYYQPGNVRKKDRRPLRRVAVNYKNPGP